MAPLPVAHAEDGSRDAGVCLTEVAEFRDAGCCSASQLLSHRRLSATGVTSSPTHGVFWLLRAAPEDLLTRGVRVGVRVLIIGRLASILGAPRSSDC
jgi:hypothetical protein